ncbi:MAG: tol-pal system protein YbgF [Nitrospirae bacterium]|nr:tol-pal system protein YbgF [Nitrospirota bacterium]
MIFKRPINIYFNLRPLFFILLSSLILSGCVATTDDMGRMQWHINELRTEIKNIKEKTPEQLQLQREKLDKDIREIQKAQESATKSVSDLLLQLQSLTSEFRTLTGRFEEARYYSEKNSAEMKAEREELTSKLRDMETALDDLKKKMSQLETAEPSAKQDEAKQEEGLKGPDAGKTTEADTASGEGKAAEDISATQGPEKAEGPAETPKPDVKDIYMTGYQAFKDGKTGEAREKLASVLKDYPDNEYADNARFWIAESYFKDGNYEDAILAYEELLKKNPRSAKVPDALLKQGLSFYSLKDEKTGKIILEKLIQDYPDSDQAAAAKKKIGKPAPSKKKK